MRREAKLALLRHLAASRDFLEAVERHPHGDDPRLLKDFDADLAATIKMLDHFVHSVEVSLGVQR